MSKNSYEKNYSSPLLNRPHAVAVDTESTEAGAGLDAAGVAWHYGSPLVEQRALDDQKTILIDQSNRVVLRVEGPDAADFLNRLLSQKLIDCPTPYRAGALNLDAQGHVLQAMQVTYEGHCFYLDLPPQQAKELVDYLTMMIFRSQVEITVTDFAVVTVLAPTQGKLEELTLPPSTVTAGIVVWHGPHRMDCLIPRDDLDEAVTALVDQGVALAGLMALTAERVKALHPQVGVDTDQATIPHEVASWIGDPQKNWPGHVHLHKGCYRGQETVSRVQNLGRSPRALVLVHVDGSVPQLPAIGTPITAGPGGRTVGRLGTIVHDMDFGPIALATIKRSALRGGGQGLHAGDAALTVDPDSIPCEEEPKPGRDAINRLKGL